MQTIFQLHDTPTPDEIAALPAGTSAIAAIKTGETREPKKGEWFVWGFVNAKAQRAIHDHSKGSRYPIARLVRLEAM